MPRSHTAAALLLPALATAGFVGWAGAFQPSDGPIDGPTDAAAGPVTPEDLTPARAPSLTLYLGGLFQAEADLDDGAGVSVSRLLAGAGLDVPLDGPLRLSVSAQTEQSWYDFSDASALFDGSAHTPELVQSTGLSVNLTRLPTAQWGWFAGVNIESSGEYDADFSDTLTYGGMAGVLYAPSPDLMLGLGVLVRTRLEDDAIIVPIPSIQWRIDERWSLGTVPMFEAAGIGATLRYQATDALAVGVGLGFARREYRLDEDIPDGILLDSSLPLVVGVEYNPNATLTMQAFAGATLWGEIETQDSSGDRIERSDADTALLAGASISVRF